jgi:large subunit ribosomal protein L10
MRPEKNSISEWIKSKIEPSPYVIIIDFATLKVSEFTELRTRLRGVGAQCRVTKNTLLRRALKELGLPDFGNQLSGQTAIVVGEKDVCAAAKILRNFSDEFKKPEIKGGILDFGILTKQQVLNLADLPSKEVLLGQILGLIQTPATQIVRILSGPATQIAQLIKAKNN